MKKKAYNLAKIKKHAAAMRKQAGSTPHIGIFWLDENNNVIGLPQDFNGIMPVGGYRTAPQSHIKQWWKMQQAVPFFRGKEYDSVSRGRVTYDEAAGRFQLMLPPHLTGNQSIINKVMKAFSLPANKTVVAADLHYQLRADQIGAPKDKSSPGKKPAKKRRVSVFDLPDGFDDPEWDD